MTAKTWTVNAIKEASRAAGSHWFDPDTMRFFGTRVLPSVYQGPGGVYFVTSEQPPHGPRQYSVRSFDPQTAEIGTVGEFCGMTRPEAVKAARKQAGGEQAREAAEEFRPVSILDQFIDDLSRHGHGARTPADTPMGRGLAAALAEKARRHHHYAELLCSDEAFCRQLNAEGEHPLILACRGEIVRLAKELGAAGVIFSGDPRGCTVKLTFADGFTDDFAKEGYCVPTSTRDEE